MEQEDFARPSVVLDSFAFRYTHEETLNEED
jgi:hypothetical protein